jgi:hypothetical protein
MVEVSSEIESSPSSRCILTNKTVFNQGLLGLGVVSRGLRSPMVLSTCSANIGRRVELTRQRLKYDMALRMKPQQTSVQIVVENWIRSLLCSREVELSISQPLGERIAPGIGARCG